MIIFDRGERKHVPIEVVSRKGESFDILKAKYELIYTTDGVTESSGLCDIIVHKIDALIEPQKTGIYLLRYTYEVADEILIENMELRVYDGNLKN